MPPRDSTPPAADDSDSQAASSPASGDALSLAAEAEAEAEEAEALAAAARARARALRLRREANAGTAASLPHADTAADVVTAAEVETDADAVAEADAVEDTPDVPHRRRFAAPRLPLRVVVGALAILLTVGFIAAGGFMMWHHQQVVVDQQNSAEFEAAARQGVVTLMSLDFTKAKDDVQRILDNTTGEFREEFAGQADAFTQVATQSKVVTEATVNAVAVRAMTEDTANVLVSVTTRVSNAAAEQQPPRSWRLSVDVARDGEQIKLAKVEFVP